jgi:hypothetical protein
MGIGLASAAFVLIIWNWLDARLRFSNLLLNHLFLLASLSLPWIALSFLGRLAPGWKRRVVALLVAPTLLVTLPLLPVIGVGIASVLWRGPDSRQKLLTRVDMGAYQVALYRAGPGFMTDVSVIVRQERPLLPGLLLVRDVDRLPSTSAADCAVLAPDQLRVDMARHGMWLNPRTVTYQLNRSLLFGGRGTRVAND